MRVYAAAVIFVAALLASCLSAAGENWPGYEGGNSHQNASAVDVDLAKVKSGAVLWEARFDNPIDCKTTMPGFFGSRNLALVEGKLAMVACIQPVDVSKMEKDFSYACVTILDVRTGKALNCIATTEATGPRRSQFRYPVSNYMEAYDTGIGLTAIHWDPQTGVLFLRNGGDNPSNTAYLPLANAAGFAGKPQRGVGAYEEFIKKHPDWTDADGNTRQKKEIPQDAKRWLDGDQWDYGNSDPKSFNNQPNSTAFFEVDPDSPLMAAAIDPAHHQSWGFFLCNKFTGQYAKPYRREYAPGKQLFAKWGGVMVGGGRVFFMGPCADTAGDGFDTGLMKMTKPDQGLRLSAMKVAWSKKQNAGSDYAGAGKDDTAALTEGFNYEFHSPHKPDTPEDAESYLELDAFYRNKAWLIDGAGVWAAWKKTQAGNVELIHCDDVGSKTFDLGLGAGQRGQDIWPHISLATAGGAKRIVYYAGNALYRKFNGRQWEQEAGAPLGPAALAVFNAATGKGWTYTFNKADGTGPHKSLPPNEAEGYFDRSQLVVAGKYALVGWVDAGPDAAGNAALHVLAFDITADKPPQPAEFIYDLGIKKADSRRSCVFDMLAADGVLYVLVTESDTLDSGHHTWKAQRVIAIGTGAVAGGLAPVGAFAATSQGVPATTQAGQGAWHTLFADEQWYKDQPGKEQVFSGTLSAVANADGPSTLMRTSYYRLGERTLYTGAKKLPLLDKLVGKKVEIRGKPVDMELEGQSLKELWPAAVRSTP